MAQRGGSVHPGMSMLPNMAEKKAYTVKSMAQTAGSMAQSIGSVAMATNTMLNIIQNVVS